MKLLWLPVVRWRTARVDEVIVCFLSVFFVIRICEEPSLIEKQRIVNENVTTFIQHFANCRLIMFAVNCNCLKKKSVNYFSFVPPSGLIYCKTSQVACHLQPSWPQNCHYRPKSQPRRRAKQKPRTKKKKKFKKAFSRQLSQRTKNQKKKRRINLHVNWRLHLRRLSHG